MRPNTPVLPLQGVVQHYAWGGFEFIPQLLQIETSDQQPFAELWMGTHHRGEARIRIGQEWIELSEYIAQTPVQILGPRVADQFDNQLPYLFKILDVRQMLSIQCHPSKERAAQGFIRENKAGIPLNAPHRIYKDENHKPEVMVALSNFWLLHGFQTINRIVQSLQQVPELKTILQLFEENQRQIPVLYQQLMEMTQPQVDAILLPLKKRLQTENPTDKNLPDFWAKRAFEQFKPKAGICDRGVFSIYLFNIVYIAPGQSIYQGAGIPHAYLEGVNVELMANSDNVFRGGLTVKHINTRELIENLVFDPVVPQIEEGLLEEGIRSYPTPAPDFELSSLKIPQGESIEINATSPETLIVLEGSIRVDSQQTFTKGNSFFVPAGNSYKIVAEEKALIFRAGVPK